MNIELPRHKVFVSYCHYNNQNDKNRFIKLFGNYSEVIIDGSVSDGDIDDKLITEIIRQKIRDNYLKDTSITIVLIGQDTWKRKHIDWEISSSIRNTEYNRRSGLIGIFLPSHDDFGKEKYDPHKIPPRLYDNVECNFAKLYDWTKDTELLKKWTHEAYERKSKIDPDNSRKLYRKNRTGNCWQD